MHPRPKPRCRGGGRQSRDCRRGGGGRGGRRGCRGRHGGRRSRRRHGSPRGSHEGLAVGVARCVILIAADESGAYDGGADECSHAAPSTAPPGKKRGGNMHGRWIPPGRRSATKSCSRSEFATSVSASKAVSSSRGSRSSIPSSKHAGSGCCRLVTWATSGSAPRASPPSPCPFISRTRASRHSSCTR